LDEPLLPAGAVVLASGALLIGVAAPEHSHHPEPSTVDM